MKITVNLVRIIVGVLFIFSGLVKANDPAGLSYKMHEFFEAWGMQGLNSWALIFAVLIIAFEIIAGIALLLGWQKKINLWLLLGLIIFFTFLTVYALYAKNSNGSPKFKACGCFGDCIPIEPKQSFLKDVILTVLILFLLIFQKYIQPIFTNKKLMIGLIIIGILLSFGIQKYTLDHLPFKDCLSFKVGNNLLQKRTFVPDSVYQVFYYKNTKDGSYKSFSAPDYPDWYLNDSVGLYEEDSAKTQTTIIKKGNSGDIIRDFNLRGIGGTDSTETLLMQEGNVHLLVITDINADGKYSWSNKLAELSKKIATKSDSTNNGKDKLYVITNRVAEATSYFKQYGIAAEHILFCDEKPLLAAARTRPAIITCSKANIIQKLAYSDWGKLTK